MGKIPLIVFFIAIICLCGCIGPEEDSTPENTIQQYYKGLNERNPEKVLETLSQEVIDNAGGEKAILAALEDTINNLEENNLMFEIEEISSSIKGFQATVNAILKMYPVGSSDVSKMPYTFELILEDEKWKIKDIS
ncbi:MAG TPA: hypothetical protein PK718_07495 [Candidatus Methanofastidiosa archaeon]|nr:hypothetical protein [Candidatus Methanofastidiosa archaeon]HPR42370.1 hypothetical protein [Candidatus Methanofastidiosa archaeon]